MTMILVAVDFDAPIALPGKRAETTFPPPLQGWAAFAGWRMYVEDGRLCIVAPPGEATLGKVAQSEMEANGLKAEQTMQMVSIPLHRCTLRYAGTHDSGFQYAVEAPSKALTKAMKPSAPPPAPVVKVAPEDVVREAPKKKPAPPPQNHAPQPLRRNAPPGAKPMVQPPISKEIEVDGEIPKTKRNVPALEVEST